MHANPSSHVQKARPIKAITNVGDRTEKLLCVHYAELMRLRQKVLEAESTKSTRDNRIDLK
jgi:hypothetical protein